MNDDVKCGQKGCRLTVWKNKKILKFFFANGPITFINLRFVSCGLR